MRNQLALTRQAGTYLLLEKLKMAVFRRLFKRVACLHAEQDPEKFAQVPLSASLCGVPTSLIYSRAVWCLHAEQDPTGQVSASAPECVLSACACLSFVSMKNLLFVLLPTS